MLLMGIAIISLRNSLLPLHVIQKTLLLLDMHMFFIMPPLFLWEDVLFESILLPGIWSLKPCFLWIPVWITYLYVYLIISVNQLMTPFNYSSLSFWFCFYKIHTILSSACISNTFCGRLFSKMLDKGPPTILYNVTFILQSRSEVYLTPFVIWNGLLTCCGRREVILSGPWP